MSCGPAERYAAEFEHLSCDGTMPLGSLVVCSHPGVPPCHEMHCDPPLAKCIARERL